MNDESRSEALAHGEMGAFDLTQGALRDAAVKVWTQAYQRLRELEESGSHGCENGAAKAYEAGRITALSVDLWEALGVPRPDEFNTRPVDHADTVES